LVRGVTKFLTALADCPIESKSKPVGPDELGVYLEFLKTRREAPLSQHVEIPEEALYYGIDLAQIRSVRDHWQGKITQSGLAQKHKQSDIEQIAFWAEHVTKKYVLLG
jgi:hypothetical protein